MFICKVECGGVSYSALRNVDQVCLVNTCRADNAMKIILHTLSFVRDCRLKNTPYTETLIQVLQQVVFYVAFIGRMISYSANIFVQASQRQSLV